jgi:peptidoglycan/xylan/chitin deacetylase (PgdA/CDA1 family)
VKRPWWRRPSAWASLVLAALFIIFLRRWIHHAQLESVPVIVPSSVPAQQIVNPPPIAIARRMAIEAREYLGRPQRPKLAVLTFDDGPFPVITPLLLAQLRALGVPAVFFVIGRDAKSQPAITLRAARAGVELGNHTLTHPEMGSLSYDEQRAEVAGGAQVIASLTGAQPTYFRPPHGNYDAATIDAARSLGETMVLWDVDPGDWRSISADEIVARVTAQARSPAVILLHNGKEATVEALPSIVRAYRNAGFEFVTLSQLQARLPLEAVNDPLRVTVTP